MSKRITLPISLIITTFNEQKSIEGLVKSIVEQSVLPKELVICDAGSKDDTIKLLEQWRTKLPFDLKIVVKRGANISHGRNVAIANATQDIIAVTDGGCKLSKHWLEHISKPLLVNDETVQVAYGSTEARGESLVGRFFAAFHYIKTNVDEITQTELSSRSVIFTKAIWQKSGGYPENLSLAGEDTLYFINLAKITKSAFVKEAVVYWYHGAESLRKVFKMHHRNSIGSGEALMWPLRYTILASIYNVVASSIILSYWLAPYSAVVLSIFVLFLSRFSLAVYRRTRSVSTFFIMPAIVLVRDIAMISGFYTGLANRYKLLKAPKNKSYVVLLSAIAAYTAMLSLGRAHNVHILSLLSTIVAPAIIFWLPGFLFIRLLKIKRIKPIDSFLFSVGLSIASLFMIGLIINTFLPIIGLMQPLSWTNVTAASAAFNILLLAANYVRRIDLSIRFTKPKLSKIDITLYTIPVLFVLGAIFGATSLNNGGTNTVSMIVLLGIAIYIISILYSKRTDIGRGVYPFSLYFICLALVFMVSLRGWVISGHDILSEYSVFELTKSNFRWNISYFRDAYNACLSITMLPTMISSLMPSISDQYILRGVFQVLFALSPVALYRLSSRFINYRFSYLAVLFFMSQSPFLRDFAYLTRQEIAILFYILMLLALATIDLSRLSRIVLSFIFGLSMIVSHYSTTYIAIGVLVLAQMMALPWVTTLIDKIVSMLVIIGHKISRSIHPNNPYSSAESAKILRAEKRTRKEFLPGWIFTLTLLLTAVAWNSWITHTSNNLESFTKIAYQTVTGHDPLKGTKSGLSAQISGPASAQNNSESIRDFHQTNIGSKFSNASNHYASEEIGAYNPQINIPFQLKPSIGPTFTNPLSTMGTSAQTAVKLFVLIGVIIWLPSSYLKRRILDKEYGLLAFAATAILGVAILLPVVAANYDVLRTYQQLLVILAVPSIVAAFMLLSLVFRKYAYHVLVLFYVLYYLFISPFIPQIIGSGYAHLQLNNYGLYYNIYYTHLTEYQSIQWLAEHDNNSVPIYADWFASKKINNLDGNRRLWVIDNVLPENITKGSYVYSSYTNTTLDAGYDYYRSVELNYKYPTKFLQQNKDLIYSNGSTRIYK